MHAPQAAIARGPLHSVTLRQGSAIGDPCFWGVLGSWAVARRNLEAAFEREAARVEAVARQVFCNIGKTLIEFLRLPSLEQRAAWIRCGNRPAE